MLGRIFPNGAMAETRWGCAGAMLEPCRMYSDTLKPRQIYASAALEPRCDHAGIMTSLHGDNFFAQGIFNQLCTVVQVEFGHKPCFMTINSFGADDQHISDLLGRMPFGQ